MKYKFKFLSALTIFLLATNHVQASNSFNIVALVNGEIISSQDIKNRTNAFVMTTGISLNSQTKKMINQRVIRAAIDEKIKLQAADAHKIKVSDQDINASIKNFELNNNIPQGTLPGLLKNSHVSMSSFRSQMKADLAWLFLVKNKLRQEGALTQKEIEKAMAEAKQDLSTPKYQISEIFIKKSKADNINYLVEKLRSDPRFHLYALQFSDSPSASNGGNLGWINQGKLPAKLEKAVKRLEIGQTTDAIAMDGGFYILKLNQIFDPKIDKPQYPTEAEIRRLLTNQKMEHIAQKYLQELRQKAVIELR